MKRTDPIPAAKSVSILDILQVPRPANVMKPVRLKTKQIKIMLLVAVCFLLPGYPGSVNWDHCATVINEKCTAIPAVFDSALVHYERRITHLFGRFLQMDEGVVTASKKPGSTGIE